MTAYDKFANLTDEQRRRLDIIEGEGYGQPVLARLMNDALTPSDEAAAVADIATPATATAEDCANKINELLASLRAAGILAS